MTTKIEALRYNEAVELPKFKTSLDRLLKRRNFDFILTEYHLDKTQLVPFVEQAISEGNDILIQKEYLGYFVTLWKD